ncbi:hypothetical protein ALQ77_200013 [Pseudomonas corrugata]|uniref:Uncharacterized protein n=1 Tax=Pseudomonas corrugata TaxID=47879 RepID=A0A3M3DSA3_9PSED|nr:hypothetical protein ALQ77_200013 [Pseudomonas corrugata]
MAVLGRQLTAEAVSQNNQQVLRQKITKVMIRMTMSLCAR